MTVFEIIEKQQDKEQKGSLPYAVGETLKAICAADPRCAELVAEDLQNESMSIRECAKKNKENADRIHKEQKGDFVYVPPEEEERIIREFYGLPAASAPQLTVIRPEQADIVPDMFATDDDFSIFDL